VRRITTFTFLAVTLAASAGCPGGDDLPDAGDLPGGEAELGTGTVTFEPLADEQRLGLWTGIQGGYHFVVSSRIRMMAPGNPMDPVTTPSTRFKVFREDGTQIDKQNPAYRIAYDDTGDGWYTMPGGRVAQINNSEYPGIIGTRVRIRLEVRDENGVGATDERWVVAFDLCAEQPETCSFGKPAP
jgi:hypothetical protein